MTDKLLTEQYLELLSLKRDCTGSSESTLVQYATLLEITCLGSYVFNDFLVTVKAALYECVIRTCQP